MSRWYVRPVAISRLWLIETVLYKSPRAPPCSPFECNVSNKTPECWRQFWKSTNKYTLNHDVSRHWYHRRRICSVHAQLCGSAVLYMLKMSTWSYMSKQRNKTSLPKARKQIWIQHRRIKESITYHQRQQARDSKIVLSYLKQWSKILNKLNDSFTIGIRDKAFIDKENRSLIWYLSVWVIYVAVWLNNDTCYRS